MQYPDDTQVQTANILGNSSIDDCSKRVPTVVNIQGAASMGGTLCKTMVFLLRIFALDEEE